MDGYFCRLHTHTEPIEATLLDTGQKLKVCPHCWTDKELDFLNEDFLKIYHSTPINKMAQDMHTFLLRQIFLPFRKVKHYVYLLQWTERFSDSTAEELPGMVYGMLSDAWDWLLKEMKRRIWEER